MNIKPGMFVKNRAHKEWTSVYLVVSVQAQHCDDPHRKCLLIRFETDQLKQAESPNICSMKGDWKTYDAIEKEFEVVANPDWSFLKDVFK